MPKESSDGLPDVWTAKDKASYNRYQRSLRNVHLPDVWTDKDKASYDRYQQSLGKMKESLTTEKDTELKASRSGRGSGKAAPFDSEGGMRPGQSPSLYNPLKEKKGGTIKKKYAVGGKVSTAEKRNPKNPCW